MRYFVRDKILEMMPTLKEAVNYVNRESIEQCSFVISDLKAGISSIRTTFNESFTIETNNKYDSIMTQVEQCLIQIENKKIENVRANKEVREFRRLLDQLQKELQNEPEVKLEILFIPYKYSMWDSLESIWLAAKDDPRCNAHVMPIPYYDRDENGLLADFHYEIEEYIKNGIPVVSYKDYDYTVIRPDIIYFHNPYDGNNRVTSVAPEFYTDNLKHYTDMLVYVPYFIAIPYETTSESKSFCESPGVANAKKVILQSNELKEVYIKNGVNKEKLEVLGTPKIDALLKRLKVSPTPSKWKNFKDKKVLLYNSSISSLLNKSDYFIRLREQFEYILSKEECVLIWRPHPLLEVTIKSMSPGLLEAFKKIRELVMNSDNGFIDNSSDPSDAFNISSALITDRSSLIQEYIFTEKPIYIMDISSSPDENTFITSDIYSCYFDEEIPIEEFIDMVLTGNDNNKEKRIDNFSRSIVNSHGRCGEMIHHHLIKDLL